VIATIAAACGGFLAGWICRTALERRQAAIALRARARELVNAPYSSAAIAFCATQEDAAILGWTTISPLRQALDEDRIPRQQTFAELLMPPVAPPTPRRPGPYSNHPQGLPPPPPKAGCTRWFMNNPAIIAKCGGPCTAGHSHCDCGALWVDVLGTNPPPGGTP
jgi:hypothetical protein